MLKMPNPFHSTNKTIVGVGLTIKNHNSKSQITALPAGQIIFGSA
jgi:hypothetical protein